MLKFDNSYGPVYRNFQWRIPEYYNIGVAAHEYPREIEFVSELPLTTTGKIVRKEFRELEIKRRSP